MLAQRLTKYLKQNHFIDTSIQKAGIAGFSGCHEHSSIIWHQNQTAKKEGKDLHVLFLDLTNAYGSVPHSLLWTAFEFFQVPSTITNLVKHYFQDLQFCLTTSGFTTSLQPREVGIMAVCISPLVFTMAMEIIIRASLQKRQLVVEEVRRRRRESDMSKLSQWPSRGDGPTGRAWRRKSSAGVTSGRWRDHG